VQRPADIKIRAAASTVGIALAWQTATALACSGPGARAAIERAELLGWLLFAASTLLCLGAMALPKVRSAGPRVFWPLLIPPAIHPGWWMSARSGDCGSMRTLGAIAVSGLVLVALAIVLWRAGRRARRS
jgi:hypothetical protein